jgi:peptide/nickel transport system substrate-binding protein
MYSFRYLTRLTLAFLSRFRTLLIVGVIVGVVIFIAMEVVIPGLFEGKHERIGLVGLYHTSDLPLDLLHLMGDGLTTIDESGVAQPALAKEWESTDNGKTWKFILDDTKYWQDGTKVIAGSIKYSFEDVEINIPDPHTIIFKLKDPFAPFPTVVSRPTFKKGLLGTGKWRVQRIGLSGDTIHELELLDSNSNKRTYRFYPTEERAKIAFKLGEISKIMDLSTPEPFNSWSTTTIERKPNEHRLVGIFFNTEDKQLVSEKKMRQALAYAVNKENFGEERAISTIPPTSWAYNPQAKPYDYDPQRSKDLIKSLNLPKEQLSSLHIKLATTPLLLEIAEKIAEDWKDVGVTTTVQVASTIPDDYQAYLAMYDMPSDPDEYITWHSTQTETNITNYKNPRVDKLLEEGRQQLDPGKRKSIYLDFQRFLLEDVPVAILYFPSTYTVTRK